MPIKLIEYTKLINMYDDKCIFIKVNILLRLYWQPLISIQVNCNENSYGTDSYWKYFQSWARGQHTQIILGL